MAGRNLNCGLTYTDGTNNQAGLRNQDWEMFSAAGPSMVLRES